jgi:hypothetical protein
LSTVDFIVALKEIAGHSCVEEKKFQNQKDEFRSEKISQMKLSKFGIEFSEPEIGFPLGSGVTASVFAGKKLSERPGTCTLP